MFKWITHNVDYFARPVQIRFHNKEKYSTVIGKFLSLIIYGVTLSLILNSWSNLINKKNPRTSMTNSYQVNSLLMNLSALDSLYIANFLTKDYVPFKDTSYFTIETNLFEVKRYANGTSTFNNYPLKQSNCSVNKEKYSLKGYEKDFINNNLDEAICIDLNSQDIVLGGNFNSPYFSNFNYKIKKCVNSTNSNITCKSPNEIDQKLKGGLFQFFYFDNYVDYNDYSINFKENFATYFILLDPSASKFVDLYFKYVNITSDVGLIFESKEYNFAIAFDYYKEQIDTSSADDLILEFYVNSSRNYLTYSRIYIKFQEFAATIGGLLKIMTFIGSIITSKFTKFEMYEKMLNSIFDLSAETVSTSNEKLEIKHNTSNIPMFNNMISKKDLFYNSKLNQNDKKDNIELINYLKSKLSLNKNKSEIKLGTIHLIKMHFCFCTRKQKEKWNMFNYAYPKLIKYLDYLKINNTMQEFNRMKKILFNDSQRKMLSICSKPNLYEKKLENIENEDKKIATLFYHFNQIKEDRNDPINQKLLKFMDNKYRKVFEEII